MKKEIVRIKELSKVFPAPHPIFALKNINLSIEKGAIFGVIGGSGAGKSTLLRCLTGLDLYTSGEIWIEGELLCRKELLNRRRKMGMIFQHFNLFSFRNALENVMYPLEINHIPKVEAKKRARELLHLVGLSGKEEAYPTQMSGGEKQRVAIARALAHNPSILFSDESTSALDPPTKKAILSLLSDLNKKLGLTILLITHEMDVIKEICTDVAVFEKGEVIEQGKVEHLFAHPKHPTTKRFLNPFLQTEIPKHIFDKHEDKEFLCLYFKGESAKEPIISRLIKNFNVEVNILLGGIDALREKVVGHLFISLNGSFEERKQAHLFLEQQGVHFEVIKK